MNADFKINGKVIQTDRLILRPFRNSDLDDFFEYAKVEGVGEKAGWKHHETKEETREILNKFIEYDKTFAVVLKDTNKLIGSIGVEKYSIEDKLSDLDNLYGRELGAVISKDYWNMGLMTEGLKAVIEYLFNEIDLDFIIAGYFDKNYASKRMQEKCGFMPYRSTTFDTNMGTKEKGVINLLLNPNKDNKLNFSHP